MTKLSNTLLKKEIAIIGLGYVGLPLAMQFSKKYKTIGYDLNSNRIEELNSGFDKTNEVAKEEILANKNLLFTDSLSKISHCNCFIVTVPTPIDSRNVPDLEPLLHATKKIATILKKGDIVIYESTVYPGTTEEECAPLLEELSGLSFNDDFFLGYSPERVNPGDKEHKVGNITKITSGSTPEVAAIIDQLYSSIIQAGTYQASSIRVAEAAKVIENTQRDVNIGLINEFAIIFNKLNIDTQEVLEAAETKWNFLPFRPGLVGGHCIGVDPYYLTYKAQNLGYEPEIILAGRRLNDSMGSYVAKQTLKALKEKSIKLDKAKILIMGLTFKENCSDIRNSKVVDIYKKLESSVSKVDCFDPYADSSEAEREYGIKPINAPERESYDAIILAVAHRKFIDMGAEGIKRYGKKEHVIYDLKYILPRVSSDIRL